MKHPVLCLLSLALAACAPRNDDGVMSGYAEADLVYVAPTWRARCSPWPCNAASA